MRLQYCFPPLDGTVSLRKQITMVKLNERQSVCVCVFVCVCVREREIERERERVRERERERKRERERERMGTVGLSSQLYQNFLCAS